MVHRRQLGCEQIGTSGLTGASSYLGAAPSDFPFPTHGFVSALVGFCLLDILPGLSIAVYDAAIELAGVIGAAVVTGQGYSVVVEVTAENQEDLAALLNQVSGLPGVRSAATASGASTLGTGFPESTS